MRSRDMRGAGDFNPHTKFQVLIFISLLVEKSYQVFKKGVCNTLMSLQS